MKKNELFMNKKELIAMGVFLVFVGLILFLERGYFASIFLDASVLGNEGWSKDSENKIKIISISGGFLFVIGALSIFIGYFRK